MARVAENGVQPASRPPQAVAALSVLALTGFAANSLLCRAALRPHLVDAPTFTLVRLASGALVLGALLLARGSRPRAVWREGSWKGALALFAYALAFSYAYLRLTAGTGALILFGAVQVTMMSRGLIRGERVRVRETLGLFAAATGLVVLCLPGLSAPDPLGALLMAFAGASWGAYSLMGRGAVRPLMATAANFARSLPFAALGALASLPLAPASPRGLALAAASGSLASGLGYSIWYAALPSLTATRAAIVQLSVPVLAAVGGVLLLGETLTLRLVAAAVLVLGGIGLAVLRPRPPA